MKKLSEKTILKTPVFDAVEKELENTSFKPVGLNCKDWCLIYAYDNENLLLVKQTRYGIENQTIEYPCGTVEDGEEPIDAVVRELLEETGIEVDKKDVESVGSFNPNPAYFNNKMHVFAVEIPDLKEKLEHHKELMLDENEDCEPFIADRGDKKILTPSGITLAANYILFCRV